MSTVTLRYALLDEIPGQLRQRLRLSGPDTRRFLHGTLTADVEGMATRPGWAEAAALCTVKGKLVSELVLVPGPGEDVLDLLAPADTVQALAADFDKHIIMDDVEVHAPVPISVAVLWDPSGLVPAAPTAASPAQSGDPSSDGAVTWVQTRHPAPSWLCVGSRQAVRAAVEQPGHEAVDADGWNRHRIATASPAWGRELEAGFFPPEVGFVYAVSYDKGCFLGQEPLARIHARGAVNRVMVRVRAERAPSEVVVLASDEREDAGRWTTWAPAEGEGAGVVGLAIVRRSVGFDGAKLRTSGDDPIEVVVSSGPLGDDPGVGGSRSRATTVKLGRR